MDSEQQQLARGGGVGISIDGKAAAVREASFRVYYSLRAGAVPFLWESAPGTPKCGGAVSRLEDSSPLPVDTASGGGAGTSTTSTMLLLPPISPPPLYSYQSSSRTKRRRRSSSWTAGGIVRALLGVLGLRESRRRRRPASSSR